MIFKRHNVCYVKIFVKYYVLIQNEVCPKF